MQCHIVDDLQRFYSTFQGLFFMFVKSRLSKSKEPSSIEGCEKYEFIENEVPDEFFQINIFLTMIDKEYHVYLPKP